MGREATDFQVKTVGRRALSPLELAQLWGVCKQTIYNQMSAGELRSFKVRGRRLIPISEVERIEKGEARETSIHPLTEIEEEQT